MTNEVIRLKAAQVADDTGADSVERIEMAMREVIALAYEEAAKEAYEGTKKTFRTEGVYGVPSNIPAGYSLGCADSAKRILALKDSLVAEKALAE